MRDHTLHHPRFTGLLVYTALIGSSERNRICFLLGIQNGCLPGGVVVEKEGGALNA